MNNWVINNIELIGGFIASIFAFFGGRKSRKQNEKTTELENIERVRAIEKKLLKDMEQQVDELIKYNNYLEDVVKKVKQQLVKYVDKYGQLKE